MTCQQRKKVRHFLIYLYNSIIFLSTYLIILYYLGNESRNCEENSQVNELMKTSGENFYFLESQIQCRVHTLITRSK